MRARRATRAAVGVVVAARDGGRYLGEALESILGQTRAPADVVVVDDGSTDGTRDIVRSFAPAVRCIARSHRGLGAARNAGVAAVAGRYVAFLDQDDLWSAQKLELQLEAIESRVAPDLVFGHVCEFVSPELGAAFASRLRCVAEPRPAALPGTMLARRGALARVGAFSTRWVGNDFMAWLLLSRELGLREVMLPEHVLSRRLHAANFSHGRAAKYAEYVRVLRESLERRRAVEAA